MTEPSFRIRQGDASRHQGPSNWTPTTGLNLTNVHKSFGETRALTGVSFDVSQGEVVALLGPSGCGKSTILAIVAGLEPADQGEVYWAREPLKEVPPHRRDFGLMFQDYALFPHLNVFDNVAFGLRMANLPQAQINIQVAEVLELVGLPGSARRDVNTLSGGEQQRVALARSLVPHPRLLMLDEPLGSLDRNLRERLVMDLRPILRSMNQTAIYVTHDQEEAFAIADRVVLLNAGVVEQVGTPQAIYGLPASVFAARFLGLNNLLPGEVRMVDGQLLVDTAIGQFPIDSQIKGQVTVLLRPDAVRINGTGSHQLAGIVTHRSFRGSTCRATVEVNAMPLSFDFLSSAPLPEEGKPVKLSFDPQDALQIFRPAG